MVQFVNLEIPTEASRIKAKVKNHKYTQKNNSCFVISRCVFLCVLSIGGFNIYGCEGNDISPEIFPQFPYGIYTANVFRTKINDKEVTI